MGRSRGLAPAARPSGGHHKSPSSRAHSKTLFGDESHIGAAPSPPPPQPPRDSVCGIGCVARDSTSVEIITETVMMLSIYYYCYGSDHAIITTNSIADKPHLDWQRHRRHERRVPHQPQAPLAVVPESQRRPFSLVDSRSFSLSRSGACVIEIACEKEANLIALPHEGHGNFAPDQACFSNPSMRRCQSTFLRR